jgi:hypothetical protein
MMKFNNTTSGGNPFANFNSITTNNMPQNSGPNNFNKGFVINQPMIEKMDYRNKNNLLQNNVNEDTLLEQVIEYYINIDSVDRSLVAYPNPFKFTLTFGGMGPVAERKTFVKKNFNIVGTVNASKYESKKINYEGTPGPIINREFKNVKYLRIDYLILPKTNIVEITDPTEISNSFSGSCPPEEYCLSSKDKDKIAFKYKYLILRINEIRSDKILGTNKNIENDCFILYPDKILGAHHIMWLPTSGTRSYKNSLLDNIKKLTFEILTPKGEQIYIFDSDGKVINPTDESNKCLYECVNDNIQVNLALVFGVVENELNTNTKFEY